jgi:uncharacterized protein YegJ (DUF2314 family)
MDEDACGCVSRQENLHVQASPMDSDRRSFFTCVLSICGTDAALYFHIYRYAQDTMYIFRRAFLSPKPSYEFMSVKVRFETGEGTEDMWTEPIELIDNTFLVRMIEGVALEMKAHPDRYVEVPAEEVIDWMILETDGTVQGAYTLRIFYDSLSPEEQEQYRQNTGYLRFE